MPRAVIVDYEKCTGCRICEIVCSTKNESGVSYERSRIRVYTLPKRILAQPLPSGVAKGRKLTRAKLSHMLDEYYELRRWDKNTGIPTREKLRELELDFVKG